MSVINKIWAIEILDSRGNPTILAEVETKSGAVGKASVPSGASTGIYEAVELRDNDKKRYLGKGVLNAVEKINKIIAKHFVGKFDVLSQEKIDKELILLDGTENKKNLGANAILAVSLAVAKARAVFNKKELYEELSDETLQKQQALLPLPMMNIINGGAHADNNLDFQEFMIVPISALNFKQALRMGAEIFHSLKEILQKEGFRTTVGDEGGFAPKLKNNAEALNLILKAIKKAGYKPKTEIAIALDIAASEFYNKKKKLYFLKGENKVLTSKQLIEFYKQLLSKFPIVSIEDGLDQDDWEGYKELTYQLGKKIQIVGDDFFVTNATRLKKGILEKACNSILIKPNQIGTLTETLETINIAKKAGFTTIISHRSGETEDTTIADLAVATKAGQIKTGSLCRAERTAKYNRLLYIEHLNEGGKFLGGEIFKNI